MELVNCNQAKNTSKHFFYALQHEKKLEIKYHIKNREFYKIITKSIHLISFTIKNIISLSNLWQQLNFTNIRRFKVLWYSFKD